MGKSSTLKTSDVIPLRRLRHLDHAVFGHLVIARQSSPVARVYLDADADADVVATPRDARRNRIVRAVSFDVAGVERKIREKRERKQRKSAGDAATKSAEPSPDAGALSELFARNVDDEDVFEEAEDGRRPPARDNAATRGGFQRQNSAPARLTATGRTTSNLAARDQIVLSTFEELDEELNYTESTTCVLRKKPAQRAFSEPAPRRAVVEAASESSPSPPPPLASPTPSRESAGSREGSEGSVLTLLDDLLYQIYEQQGCASPSCRRYSTSSVAESDCWSTASSYRGPGATMGDHASHNGHRAMQEARLRAKGLEELRAVHDALVLAVQHAGARLLRNLRRREALVRSRERKYDVVTAHLQARSEKRMEDTRIRFSAMPHPGDSGFAQWHDAMKMVARLPGGIPPDFRRRLWLTLAEKHLEKRRVDWRATERNCFHEWTNPDDEDLGVQIVKDLHRTGCSLFCGAAAEQNQALLKRVLLGFARWNKTVGYCQGFNMLAALILQVVDRSDSDALKVMIYLIEGVLPESYFANNLRGLSVDMAVFRDLLGLRLPALSRHLEQLQQDAGDATTGTSYEPPLTNVFTMQWFLTLFSNCLPQPTVLRVWDLVFLEGNGVLLRTALAIWETLQERIMAVESADEFYSIMGVLTREMLEFGLMDSNNLVKAVVRLPLPELSELRDRHLYDISPWSNLPSMVARRSLRLFHAEDTDDDTDDDAKLAVAATYGLGRPRRRRDSTSTSLSSLTFSPERDRVTSLDISLLKEQYSKIRQRQRQAHIILSAACARQPLNVAPAGQVAMNHLLLGKSALISMRGRRGAPPGAVPPPVVRGRGRRDKELRPQPPTKHGHLVTSNSRVTCPQPSSGETLHWKDASSRKPPVAVALPPTPSEDAVDASDSSSTSTELCDEPDRLSDFDSEPTSLVIDDDDDAVDSGEALKECVQVKEQIEKKVRELFRDFSKEDDDDGSGEKVDALVDLTEVGAGDVAGTEFDGLAESVVAEASIGDQDTVENDHKDKAQSVNSFLDFRNADTFRDKEENAFEPDKLLADQKALPAKEPFSALFDVDSTGAVVTGSLGSAKSPEDPEVSRKPRQLSSDLLADDGSSVDSLLGLGDAIAASTEELVPGCLPDMSSPRSVLEMLGHRSQDDFEQLPSGLGLADDGVLGLDGGVLGLDGGVLGGDALSSAETPNRVESDDAGTVAVDAAQVQHPCDSSDVRLGLNPADEDFLDFNSTVVRAPRDSFLEFDQLGPEAPAPETPSEVPHLELPVDSPHSDIVQHHEPFVFKSILGVEDDVSDDAVLSALSICVMDLRNVPRQPLGDALTSRDAWPDTTDVDVDKSADESFEEFMCGRSKSPTLPECADQKDILKDLVSKLSLDLGGGGDVDVARRSDIEEVRAKQMQPTTPFYKPKDAKELFTIVDTPDPQDATPARLASTEGVSPEGDGSRRVFVFPVVAPSPDERRPTTPSNVPTTPSLGDDGDHDVYGKYLSSDSRDHFDCETLVADFATDADAQSPLDETDAYQSAPLEVLPLDVLPVGAAFNLGRRKSERALQLISENSEILSQLTSRERRPGNGGDLPTSSSPSPRRLAARKCPSFDVGSERVTKIAGFKFHSYSVDGGTGDGERTASTTTAEGGDSPERGAFDPFPVKRRPKQLGLYSPT